MTDKHTPGPWWIDDDGFVAAGSGDTYATIADFDCSGDIDPCEREANATLGSAAPDLLGALENLERLLAAYSNGGFRGADWHNLSKGRAAARAVVAKAKGNADG